MYVCMYVFMYVCVYVHSRSTHKHVHIHTNIRYTTPIIKIDHAQINTHVQNIYTHQ